MPCKVEVGHPRDIKDFLLLAASSWMETTPTAGKSWQPNINFHTEGRETGISHTDKTVERVGGTGDEKTCLRRVPLLKENC